MTSPRNLLLIALLFLGYLLWNAWQQDYVQRALPATTAQMPTATSSGAATASSAPANGEVPSASTPSANPAAMNPSTPTAATPANAAAPRIVVTTDVLRVEIDTRGGNIVAADLLAYLQQPKDTTHPVRLLDDSAAHFFEAQSGLVSAQPAPDHTAMFAAEKTDYALADGADSVEVPLTWTDPSGVSVRKTLHLQACELRDRAAPGNHEQRQRELERQRLSPAAARAADHRHERHQGLQQPRALQLRRRGLVQRERQVPETQVRQFRERAAQQELRRRLGRRCCSTISSRRGFPMRPRPITYTTALVQNADAPRYLIRTLSPAITVAPGETKTESARLYVGPKLQSTLDDVAPGLSLTVDYGVLTVISKPLHWILAQLHKLIGNWGFAIILLVVLIKVAFFKLSETQYRSMARMRKMQPRIEALKERYGDDRQKMNQAMMELYQKEKINPLGGCLPMLVQIPVFFALYWVLLESVELRQAPFIGWIQNLSAPDPYFVLPVLNGLAMIATQMLTPSAGMDPTQAKMMKIMPVAFSVLFAFFPAGLVLYWTVNGTLSLLQQWIITKRIDAGEKAKA